MSKKTSDNKTNRRLFPSLLAGKYMEDYQASVAEFPDNKKVEFVEHILGCLDMMENYLADPTNENWKVYVDKENLFLKKHGKRLNVYKQKRMDIYFDKSIVLVQKGLLSIEEFNSIVEEQELSEKELVAFIRFCRNGLFNTRESLLLEQNPEDEREEEKLNGVLTDSNGRLKQKKGNIRRQINDRVTKLSQEQSALLVHYLKQERVFLNDEYLSNTDAGIAFEILTGYSKNTIRTTLGKIELYQNKTNLNELHSTLTRLLIAIEKDLKPKK